MKKLSLIALMFLFVLSGMAQDVAFRTLASKGTCMVQRGSNPDEYTNLKTGVKLFKDDKIIITGENSYLGLVSVKGKTMELTKGGIYNVNDLTSDLASQQSSLASKYVEYLVSDMSKTNDASNANMKFTGSVERSIESDGIVLFLPKSTKIAPTGAVINWYPKEKQESYDLVVTNLFDEEVLRMTTAKTSQRVDFSKLDMEAEEIYKIMVVSSSNKAIKSSIVTLEVPSTDNLGKYIKETNEIQEQTPTNSAIQNMVLAKYYDSNELYLNAIPYYQMAVEMEPEVAEYKDAYNSFLFSIGLESPDK